MPSRMPWFVQLPEHDMSMHAALITSIPSDGVAAARAALVKSLDMGSLWQSCSDLVSRALPCHSCSLLFDIDGYRPHQGHHHLSETGDGGAHLVTSLDVAAPYLDANPQIPWYTFSQIASQDARATKRLMAQNPTPRWREFIHLAFWNGMRLDAVSSIRIHTEHDQLSEHRAILPRGALPTAGRQPAARALAGIHPGAAKTWKRCCTNCHSPRKWSTKICCRRTCRWKPSASCRRWSEDTEKERSLAAGHRGAIAQWMENDAGCTPHSQQARQAFTVEHPLRPGAALAAGSQPGTRKFHPAHTTC